MSSPDPLALVEEMERLMALATPAPWSADTRESWDMVVWGPPNPEQETRDEAGKLDHDGSSIVINIGEPIARVGDVCGSQADAELIAAMRNGLAALCAAVREAREDQMRMKRLQAIVDEASLASED